MQSEFDTLGVRMLAISPDNVKEAAGMQRKGLSIPLLTDEALSVTDLYGLRHQKGFAGTPGKRGMMRPLAIPTTILIDAEGVVRWVDRSADFRVRSDAARVLGAIRPLLAS
jgi:peroxiredoxin